MKPPATPPGVYIERGQVWRVRREHPMCPNTIVITKVETRHVFARSVPDDGLEYTQSVQGFLHFYGLALEAPAPVLDFMRPVQQRPIPGGEA